jgi:hypothetical protein
MQAFLSRLPSAWLVAASVAGCQTYDNGPPRAEVLKAAAAPCVQPAGQDDLPAPAALNDVEFGTSPKARRERQNGCAAVRFHVGRDGSAKDAVLVAEAPTGYGFGQATLDGLAQTLFDPAAAKPTWYYYLKVYLPTPPPPPPHGF